MNGDVKIFYGGSDVFAGICPTPFLHFNKEFIENGTGWGSRYSFTMDGQITGSLRSDAFFDIENKKNKLISGFFLDNLPISVNEDGVNFFTSDICQIESISFEESRYFGILPFSISASCYDKASFGSNYGVTSPANSWDYSESEDGTVTLRHSVSAAGFNSSSSSAIQNARDWVNSKTGINKKIDSLKIKNLQASDFVLESLSEQVDRFNGKYSIQESYRGDLLRSNDVGAGILRYQCDISKNIEDGITTVSVDGSVVGKTNIGLANMSLLRAKLDAENFFQFASDSAFKSTGTSKLNDKPVSRSVTENVNASEISFSIKYDDNPVPPGQAKCIYKVEMSENLIKNIVDIKLDAEILCDRGDQSVRWDAVKAYYSSKFNGHNLALKEYQTAGYNKTFNAVPRSQSVNFDEFNSKITFSASWSDKYMPYPDILTSISERVDMTPSLRVHTVQPSLSSNGEHNVQFFGCASRASVTISIDATCMPDKTMASLNSCVQSELERLRAIYVTGGNLFIDQNSETVNADLRKMSVSCSYSFDSAVIS